MRALVIGGSMSGLLAALALKRRGFDVSVYERVAEPLAGRGVGIVAQPELKAVLRQVGLDPDHDLGIEVPWRLMFARDGAVTHRMAIPQTMTVPNATQKLIRSPIAAPVCAAPRARSTGGIFPRTSVRPSKTCGS